MKEVFMILMISGHINVIDEFESMQACKEKLPLARAALDYIIKSNPKYEKMDSSIECTIDPP